MSDLAELGLEFKNVGYDAAARQTDDFVGKVAKAEKATDSLLGSQKRLTASQMGLSGATKDLTGATSGATSQMERQAMEAVEMARDLAKATAATKSLDLAQDRLAVSSRVAGRAGLDLGRQLSDVGVQAAYGTSALMILISQGPQIADSLQQASKAGVGLTGVIGGMVGGLVPLAATLAPLIATVGLAAGGFALFHRELAKDYPKSLTDGLGLTTEQLKNVKNATVTLGDTWGATFTVMGRHINDTWVGGALKNLKSFTTDAFNTISLGALRVGANIAGTFAVASRLFRRDWAGESFGDTFKAAAASFRTGAAGFGAEVGAEARTRATARIIKEAGDATRATKDLAKAIKDTDQTFVSAEYMQAFADLQASRRPTLIVATKLDLTGIQNDLPKLDASFRAAGASFRDTFVDAATEISWTMDSVFRDFANKDWMSAFAGLFSAVDAFKASWNSGQPGSRVGAVAGIANAAGQAIGGTAGGALAGAAGGAMAGVGLLGAATGLAAGTGATAAMATALLASNPVGWVIGGAAVVGGLLGLFGSSKASKRQKEEERAKAAADAATLAQQEANQANEIAIQTMLLLNDAQGARNLQLQVERAGIAASNLEAFDAMVKLRDAASLRELNIQLLEAQGQGEQALAMRQADALGKLVPAEQELTKQIWAAQAAALAAADAQALYNQQLADADQAIAKAESDLQAARNAEKQQFQDIARAAETARDRLQGFVDQLTDFDHSLTGSGSGLGGSYRSARGAFMSNASRANMGDPDAQGQFVALGQAYAEAAKRNAPTQLDYLRDLAGIRAATIAAKEAAGRQISVQQQTLNAANAQISALETVNQSVLSVAEATANLAAALGAKAALTGVANDNSVARAPSADALRMSGTMFTDPTGFGYGDGAYSQTLLDQYRSGGFDHLVDGAGNPTGVLAQIKAAGFASGGFHGGGLRIVGENGPELESTGPSRIWNADQTASMLGGGGDNADVVEAVNALRGDVQSLGARLDEGNRLSGKVLMLWRMITRGENNIFTKAA